MNQNTTMIGVMLDDGVTEVFLPRVDHTSTSEDAARALWEGVHKLSNLHGGSAHLLTPDELGRASYGVRWTGGPVQWSMAYVVSDGAEAREFYATAEDEETVAFNEMDS